MWLSRASQSPLGLPPGPHRQPAGPNALREQAFPSGMPAEGPREQAHTAHHSLGDHSDLDTEDPCLFAGRHSLQAELPARELD